jgi:hypothetical protein
MRRTLILDEEDLIMVVKEDVVKQIDDNRGEMNRTEFVNHLIKCQLQQYHDEHDYVTKNELKQSMQEITGLLNNFLQFFVSYGMAMGCQQPGEELQSLNQQLESLDIPGTDEDITGM